MLSIQRTFHENYYWAHIIFVLYCYVHLSYFDAIRIINAYWSLQLITHGYFRKAYSFNNIKVSNYLLYNWNCNHSSIIISTTFDLYFKFEILLWKRECTTTTVISSPFCLSFKSYYLPRRHYFQLKSESITWTIIRTTKNREINIWMMIQINFRTKPGRQKCDHTLNFNCFDGS